MNTWLLIPWFKLEPLQLGPLKLQPFGLLAGLAMLVSSHFAQRRAAQLGVPRATMSQFLTQTTLIGVVSAYILNIVMYSPDAMLEILLRPKSLIEHWYGLSSYGGFIGGTLAAWAFARRHKLSLVALGDAWCYAFPFAWAIARLGCFSVHDHPGLPSDFFLAVADYDHSGVARHDLGLYEVLWSIPVALVFWFRSRQRREPGYFLGLVPCLYGPARFALDFLRAGTLEGGDIRYLGLTPAQYLSLALSLFGLLFCLHLRVPNTASHAQTE
jgi:phosphatidylglycerol:prolipoprotein diacylglycerol transferase